MDSFAKNEKGNRDQRVASPKGDSHNGPKSHTHKRSRGAVVELIRICFFDLTVKRQCILKALFRNKKFALNEMFQPNASKFAIFYV